jgi:integrase
MSPRLPRGVTKGPAGWRISTRVHGHLFQKRFKPSTSQETVEEELAKARKRWRAGRDTPAETPSTLKADVTDYLAHYFAGRAGLKERTRHLQLWVDALEPDIARAALTTDDVTRVLHAWRAAGLAPDTCNKRRTALLALFHALDGRGGSNPVRQAPKFRPPDPLPRGLAYDQIEKALKQLPRCKTKARLTVMAYTGMRPGQVMRLKPEDWDHRLHMITVPGTAKGRGTKAYVIPLSSQARKALKEFDTLDAWGAFTWAPMARMWKEAWIAATQKRSRISLRGVDLSNIDAPVPYDLRHSFGTAIYRATGDIQAARKLLGHSSLKMTERYTLAAVPDQQAAAIKAFEAALRPKGRKLPAKVASARKHSRKTA